MNININLLYTDLNKISYQEQKFIVHSVFQVQSVRWALMISPDYRTLPQNSINKQCRTICKALKTYQ